ncbi:short chain dehydrogenase [Mucilaginibacter lappiensis]|uniref:NAD(P)-dependent dehydrogenase (Short-subunit alcohol dehydrogenase family) n=1 Tax=Mucilaginibacter lappiensis TaxID=354630 RepID=A0ABR6PCX8_9SPHI|nr:SDR family NAD(P)-dependent oxidoreductase [Mucilaginibacter lappiensis]MBB6107621.1 NAD(P)-dependent dehydrogenase (short-subunit alcohol dehydrogenase family) [Mucilaginibacter lappiensis]SIQ02627.1 short chain dehydrogenase [Mucilaginibacter lappiensis]
MKDLIAYRQRKEKIIGKETTIRIPTKYGLFSLITFIQTDTGKHHLAFVKDDGNSEGCVIIVAEIIGSGQKAAALLINTGEIGRFEMFFGELKNTLGDTFNTDHIHFLINNAGMGIYANFAETIEENLDQLINVHFKGVFLLRQNALPLMNDGVPLLIFLPVYFSRLFRLCECQGRCGNFRALSG